MGVFTPAEREAHILNTVQLMDAVQRVEEEENGYRFSFPNETELIARLAEFIANERLCCPFLKFVLTVTMQDEPLSLSLTGPAGTQEFLREEFSRTFNQP